MRLFADRRRLALSKVLVIGAGGVGSVAVHKMAMNPDIFSEIHLASRTRDKCDAIAESVKSRTGVDVATYTLDAEEIPELVNLIEKIGPKLVVNLALPYQDLAIMEGCLRTGVDYLDTANYEPENTDDPKWRAIYEKRCKEAGFSAYFDYSWQWAYRER